MGQKDIGEKILEAYNDVFADIVNVLLFNGKQVLTEQELEERAPRSAYKADGKYREIERDVAKRWKTEDIRIACIGIENQTAIDKDMPLRVLAYDGAEYRAQLNQDDQSSRYPVVTIVLYFDYEKKWDEPLSLIECLNIPDDFKPFVNDYKVNLFDIAFLTDEQVKLFKSDFRFVADYFVQKRKTGDYIPSSEEIKHVNETLSLMSIMTSDHRFEDAISPKSDDNGKEIRTMCDVLDRVEEKGIVAGELKANIAAAKNMQEMGMDVSFIAKALKVTEDVVKSWLGLQLA